MKKLFLGLTAIVIVITGIFTFAGCEKEEENTDIHPVTASDAIGECPTCSGTDMSLDSLVYVQNHYFIDNYGINIHEFSSNTNFQQLITEINEMTSDIHEFMANADPAQLEESRQFLEQKQNELQDFENSGNNFGMLSVAEEIFAAVMPNKPLNAYTYGNHTYQLPVDYMEMKTEALSNAIHQLETLYPSLQDMPCTDYHTLLQISFIASEINGNEGLCYAKQDPPKPSARQIENCLKQAESEYNWCYIEATGAYAVGMLACTGTGPVAIGCYAMATTAYFRGVQTCVGHFNERAELCTSIGRY